MKGTTGINNNDRVYTGPSRKKSLLQRHVIHFTQEGGQRAGPACAWKEKKSGCLSPAVTQLATNLEQASLNLSCSTMNPDNTRVKTFTNAVNSEYKGLEN